MKGLACLVARKEDDLTRTLELELCALFSRVVTVESAAECPPCAVAVINLDLPHTSAAALPAERCIAFAREVRSAPCPLLARPFRMRELRALLEGDDGSAALRPSDDFRTVTVGDATVSLSDREAALLRLLYQADGSPVSRRALAEGVFPDAEAPEDAINVYIHYLRKKLERNGTRRIRAHRGGGYSLIGD